jgi:hypothetical protein
MAANGQSVDQRIKDARWMEGSTPRWQLVIQEAGILETEQYAKDSDLVLVATGKGELGKLFERDAERSVFDRPMRTIALTYHCLV